MPRGHRSTRSENFYDLSPSSTPISATYGPISARTSSAVMPNAFYGTSMSSMSANMAQQHYAVNATPDYSVGGPVQHPLSSGHYNSLVTPLASVPLPSIRPSSGAWSPVDDQTLMAARAQGMNWQPIQQTYFPSKTPNACRKRHERLMERRNADDWDGLKLETLARQYMAMRGEIWSGLAAQTGEKWNVIEQKCMSQGLKNLQQAARSGARRERMLDPNAVGGYDPPHTDGSAIGIDDLEAEYDADGASEHSGGSNGNNSLRGYTYHSPLLRQHHQSYRNQQGRLPSMDVIINRAARR